MWRLATHLSCSTSACCCQKLRGLAIPVRAFSSAPLGLDNTVENNNKTETNRLSKTLSKFWEHVALQENKIKDKITVQLDSKPIKTPLGQPLQVDENRRLLAYLLKKEWENLPNLSIKQHSLPLTSLVSRCIDLEYANGDHGNSELTAKIGANLETMIPDLLRYLDTDTLLIFSPKAEFEGALRNAQESIYRPIIASTEEFLSGFSTKPITLRTLDADLHGLRGNSQSEATKAAAQSYLRSLSFWDLAVFEKTVLTTKSFICGILLLANKATSQNSIPAGMQVSIEDIARAATLETLYQTERWGEVEDTHDVAKRDIMRNIAAAGIVAFRDF